MSMNQDVPNGDLKTGDFFIVTRWCGRRAYIKPVPAHPLSQMGTCASVLAEEGDEGAVVNIGGLDAMWEVVAIDYPSIIVKMHEAKPDAWSGKGYPMVLDCRDFETRRPSPEYTAAFLAIGKPPLPAKVEAKRPWWRRSKSTGEINGGGKERKR